MTRALLCYLSVRIRGSLGTFCNVRLDVSASGSVRHDATRASLIPLLAVVCCLAVTSSTHLAMAQDFEAFEPPGILPPGGAMQALGQAGQPEWQFGFQLFHLLLEQKGLYSVPDFREPMDHRPWQTAVILMGDLTRVPTDLRAQITEFLDNGGTVLVASDETSFFKDLFLISDGPFEVQDDSTAYQGFPDCPVIKEFRPNTPILDGINSLVANRTGVISTMNDQDGNWSILAQLPDLVGERSRRRSQAPLIAEWKSRERGGGRLLLMADHSILINGMLWHGDNAKLAVNLADWLSAGERQEIVFIVDGEPAKAMLALPPEISDELPPLEDLPTPTLKDLSKLPPDVLLKFANRFAAGMEDADVMNELLAGQPADLPTPRFRQALYIAAGILAAIYIFRLMGKVGSRPTTRPPRSVGQTVNFTQQQTLSSGELNMASRELAQNALRQLTGSADPLDWAIPVSDVEIEAGAIRRMIVRGNLNRLKKLAANSHRAVTTQRDLKRLAKLIANVVGLQKAGRLRHPTILT